MYRLKTTGSELLEDLENMTFEDETVDLITTQDVFEHLFDPQRSFSEVARTLKPEGGGQHRTSERSRNDVRYAQN